MDNFAQLNLSPALQRAITALGYSKPSPIQAEALPILLGEPTDFIGLAATGTGKTAAFTLPLLERLDPDKKSVQALILCPTRELCMQVTEQVNLLAQFIPVRALAIYGGAGYGDQLRALKQGVSVVVGTPGRIIDHLQRGTLKLDDVRTVVLDEADEMISMGFREDMETILQGVPRERSKSWFFSATMSSGVRKVADEFLSRPKQVQVNRGEMLSSTVEQIFYMTQEKNKPEVLCKLIDAADDFYGLIFAQTKSLVVDLTRYLSERGYKVDALHGDMSQSARETTMVAFRQRRIKILVCTDVASRGLDVKDVTHVINYSLPRELDNYVHRIGRTARSGKTGAAMSLVTPSHRHLLQKIERMTKSRFKEGTVPSRKEIGIKKISQLLGQFKDMETHPRALELMNEDWKQTVSGMSAEEVAARFLSLMFPWVFAQKQLPQMARSHTAVTPAPSMPEPRPSENRERKTARREEKRRTKKDLRKRFSKGYQSSPKGNGGDAPPRRPRP